MWSENEGALRPSTVLKEYHPIQPQPCAITACRQDKPCASFEKHIKLRRSNRESSGELYLGSWGALCVIKDGKEDYPASKSEHPEDALDRV